MKLYLKKLSYKIEAIFIQILFTIFSKISIDQASNFAGRFARVIGPKLPVSQIARRNIRYAMPGINETGREEIIKMMWDNLGRVFAEFPHIYSLSTTKFNERVEINGLENLEYIKQNNNVGIFFSGHMANWEVSPRIPVANGIDIALIYRHANNKFVDDIICKERSKHNITIISKGKKMAREIIATLNNNKSLAMLVDQKMNDGIEVPFFAKGAMTAPAIAKLALSNNCPIIPAQVIRKTGSVYFKVNIYPPIEVIRTGNNKADIYNIMLKINNLMEEWIIENPGQWFWLHNRWGKININE